MTKVVGFFVLIFDCKDWDYLYKYDGYSQSKEL